MQSLTVNFPLIVISQCQVVWEIVYQFEKKY